MSKHKIDVNEHLNTIQSIYLRKIGVSEYLEGPYVKCYVVYYYKMFECQTKAGNQECMNVLNNFISHSLTLDMLNNFCFHVYAQKSLFIVENCNVVFFTSAPHPVSLEFIELVPS